MPGEILPTVHGLLIAMPYQAHIPLRVHKTLDLKAKCMPALQVGDPGEHGVGAGGGAR